MYKGSVYCVHLQCGSCWQRFWLFGHYIVSE